MVRTRIALALGVGAAWIASGCTSWRTDPVARGAVATFPAPSAAPVDTAAAAQASGDRVAWIALDARAPSTLISATGAFQLLEQEGRNVLVRGAGGAVWRIEGNGRSLRAVAAAGGDATPWRSGPFVVRSSAAHAVVQHGERRYRGELWITATDSGLLVVNRVPVEAYLRGVVPLELGTREPRDAAALQAQAVAARSYAYVRVPAHGRVPASGHHMTATVQHQVYGGVAVEHPVVDAAIAATRGLVLRYQGAVVDGPYSSSCGGQTARPSEAWRTGRDHGHLHSVSDIDPATGRAFCDIAPRNRWEATFDEPLLRQAVVRHLGMRGARGTTAPTVESVQVGQRSPSGRVATLVMQTDRGAVTLSGHDIRDAFRDARGAILYSTYFDIDREARSGDRLAGLTLRGTGNGHGVGMCQWGAIGRGRAGHDVQAILRHYYPGTVVGVAD
jgi:stage II sporulation protein D